MTKHEKIAFAEAWVEQLLDLPAPEMIRSIQAELAKATPDSPAAGVAYLQGLLAWAQDLEESEAEMSALLTVADSADFELRANEEEETV